jgi:DNA repair exonuclease SbcCD nuclease subunit
MITFKDNNIAIISDTHLGIHKDSEVWHEIMLNYAKWLNDELTKKDIKDIVILGDIFNNREEIGVKTLHVSEEFFRILEGFNITVLIGNHDCFLRDSAYINSVSIFKGWNNINVVDKMTTVTTLNKNITMCPWGTKIEDIPDNTDLLLGHFEINTFKKTSFKMCEDGISSDDLLAKSKLIMSGHFHIRDERVYSNGKIMYVGCPYPQSWNDCDAEKGYYIMNLKDLSYTYTPNTISPRYYKIKLSEIFDKNKLAVIKTLVTGNFIKILVDIKIEFDKFDKILNGLMVLKPIEISNDYTNEAIYVSNANYQSVSLDTVTLLGEYLDTLDIKSNKDKIVKELGLIHEKASNKVKIESIT